MSMETCNALACDNPLEEGTRFCSEECIEIQRRYEALIELDARVKEANELRDLANKKRARFRTLHQRILAYEGKAKKAFEEYVELYKEISECENYYFYMGFSEKQKFIDGLNEKFGTINWRKY